MSRPAPSKRQGPHQQGLPRTLHAEGNSVECERRGRDQAADKAATGLVMAAKQQEHGEQKQQRHEQPRRRAEDWRVHGLYRFMVEATIRGESQQPANANRRRREDRDLPERVKGAEINQDDVDDVAAVPQCRSELGEVLPQSRSRLRRRDGQEQPSDEGSDPDGNQRVAGTNEPR